MRRTGTCAASICTLGHLHFANVLADSLKRFEPDLELFVAVVDWDGSDPPPSIGGACPLSGHAVFGADLGFLALKLDAHELCCAAKPYLLEWLARHRSFEAVIYLDADICLYAPCAALRAALEGHDFVVTPHIRSPYPQPERASESPDLGFVARAGVLNAGMIGMRLAARAETFIAQWREMAIGPGAFLSPGRTEQHGFNFLVTFCDDVFVMRDPAYNAAYWNLHERAVRWCGFDDPSRSGHWTVDGNELVAFHFSGYSLADPGLLSRYDTRPLSTMPSVAVLCERYRSRLETFAAAAPVQPGYRFESFPSGVPIDGRMRHLFKRFEDCWRSDLDPWTPEGERHYAASLLSPARGGGSLLPVLMDEVYRSRADLQRLYPRAQLTPSDLLPWFYQHGIYEEGYAELFARHRRVIASPPGIAFLESHPAWNDAVDGLGAPLGAQREKLLSKLEDADEAALASAVRTGVDELPAWSAVQVVRSLLATRPDVRERYPDPLDTDRAEFERWLGDFGPREQGLPRELVERFAEAAGGQSMARVFAHVNTDRQLRDRFPLALVGERSDELLRHLLEWEPSSTELALDDLFYFEWVMAEAPWLGIPWLLGLAEHQRLGPAEPSHERQEEILAPLLSKDARFASALERYRTRDTGPAATPRANNASTRERLPISAEERPQREVDVFYSAYRGVALGALVRSVEAGLNQQGWDVATIPLGGPALGPDARPDRLLRSRRWAADAAVAVWSPHLAEGALSAARRASGGSPTVGYLTWAQRDGLSGWQQLVGDLGQLWAPSKLVASVLARFVRRPVEVVPMALDVATLPSAAKPHEVGFDAECFNVVCSFDASRGFARYNPEGAVEAMALAFSPAEKACLWLQVGNLSGAAARDRLSRAIGRAAGCANVRVIAEPMTLEARARLVSAADCLLSLHHATICGWSSALAMAYGRPVIATAWGGNVDFMDASNSCLVRAREVEVERGDDLFGPGSVWASPDLEEAARHLRAMYASPEERHRIGRAAAGTIRARLSPSVVGRRQADLLLNLGSPS